MSQKSDRPKSDTGLDRQVAPQESCTGPPIVCAVFWGTRSRYSSIVLETLIQADLRPAAIFCAAPEPYRAELVHDLSELLPNSPDLATNNEIGLTLLTAERSSSILDIGKKFGIPTYLVGQIDAAAVKSCLAGFSPHVACVACFPHKIPPSLLAVPRYGFLNVHPSLLPAYRGPTPIEWILQDDAQSSAAGVTIHWMDEGLDTGDIAVQRAISLQDGVTIQEAERNCAKLGGELLCSVLSDLSRGIETRIPQPEGGFYRSWFGNPID